MQSWIKYDAYVNWISGSALFDKNRLTEKPVLDDALSYI